MLIFLSLSLGIPKFCSAPGAELNSAGGAENFFAPYARESAPLIFFSAPAKINPAHVTATK